MESSPSAMERTATLQLTTKSSGRINNMQFLSNGSDDDSIQSLAPRDRDVLRFSDAPWQYPANTTPEDDAPSSFNVRRLLRKYWLLVLGLMILGAVGGLASVILSSPRYKTRILLEVQNSGGSLAKNDTSSDISDIGIQTQVTLLHGGTFLKRGAERVQQDSVPM